eukprot:6655945-Karenia_brevis.AAC.1
MFPWGQGPPPPPPPPSISSNVGQSDGLGLDMVHTASIQHWIRRGGGGVQASGVPSDSYGQCWLVKG